MAAVAIADDPGHRAIAADPAALGGPSARGARGNRVVLIASVAWLAVVAVHALLYTALPWVSAHDEVGRGGDAFRRSPSLDHWFGTDKLGRDVFSRCVYGSRLALAIAVVSVVIGLAIATVLGLLAGYFRGWVDRVICTVTDIVIAFPALILLMSLTAFLDRREVLGIALTRKELVIGGLAVLAVPTLTRIVRANTLVYAQKEFVLAARSVGATHRRILWREVLPNIVPSLLSFAMTTMAVLIIAEGGLAYVGQSVPPPETTWGKLIQEGSADIETLWWVSLAPAMVLFLTVLAFNLLGDQFARRFDIKQSLA